MNYQNLKKRIKKEAREVAITGLVAYIAYSSSPESEKEYLRSNFLPDEEVVTLTDNQLFRAVDEGLLEKDWDTYLVNPN